MNKTYRVIWNANTGEWVVTSELARTKGKSKALLVAQSMACATGMGLAIVAGGSAFASGLQSGNFAKATSVGDIAYGNGSMADSSCVPSPGDSDYATAVGNQSMASGGGSSAFGSGAAAGTEGDCQAGVNATAFGSGAQAGGLNSSAIGSGANASGKGSTAIGQGAQATNESATAIGQGALASNQSATAIGQGAQALSENGVALGASTWIHPNAKSGIAIGASAKILTGVVNSIAMGVNANSSASNSAAIGASASVGSGASGALALGNGANVGSSAAGSGAMGQNATVNNGIQNALALGSNSLADVANTISIGKAGAERRITNVAPGTNDTDAVNVSQLNTTTSTAITNLTTNINMGLVGLVQQSAPAQNLTVGAATDGEAVDFADKNSKTRVLKNVSVGVADTDAVNVGQLTEKLKDIGLVDDAGDTRAFVSYDKNVDGTPNYSSVTLGAAGTPVALSNVANGSVASDSVDAVNGSQLNTAAQSVADALGGGAQFDPSTGTVTAPSYELTDTSGNSETFNNVGDALSQLDGRVDGNTTNITNLTKQLNQGQIGLVQQAAPGANLTVGAGTDGEAVDFADKDGNARTLKNVMAGVDDADAVNVSQLKEAGLIDGNGNTLAAVVYDDASRQRVTLGAAGTPVALSNVAAGSLASDSLDAVNGSQLNTAAQSVADALGGGAQFDPSTGTVTAPSYELTDTSGNSETFNNVGDALSQLDGRVDGNTTNITNLTEQLNQGQIGLVQQAASGANLTVGAGTDGEAVDFADKDGNARTLKNVMAGVDDADAVNVSQLKNAGLIDGNGNALAAVTYDQNADGSPNLGSVTLAKGGAPVSLKNVANGTDDNDAVNVSQLKAAGLVDIGGNMLDAVVYDPGMNRGQVTLGGFGSTTPVVLTNVADGKNPYDAVNFGQLSGLVTQINSVDARVTVIENSGDYSRPMPGPGPDTSYVSATQDSSINNAANSGDTAGVALGYNSVASGDNASAMGHNAQALGTYGLATGNDAYAASTGDTAIGGNAQALAGSSTAVGSNSSVNASSGTAVGQGASVEAAATNAVALGTGSVATQANSVSVGAAGAERTVTNVAAGVNATDAVNMSQLNAMSDWSKNYTDQAFSVLSRSIDKTQRRASAGTASAIAMANMPQAYQPNMNTVSAGVGTYNGQNAISVGMTGISENGRWILRAGLTANSQGDKGAGMGAAYAW